MLSNIFFTAFTNNYISISAALPNIDGLIDFLQGTASSDTVPKALDDLWKITMEGNLYQLVCKLGLLIAVFGVGFWCLKLYKSLEEGSLRPVVNDLIWPLLLVILLSNNGKNMRDATMETRNMLNSINRSADAVISADVSMRSFVRLIATGDYLNQEVNRQVKICVGNKELNEYAACMKGAKVIADGLLSNNANWPTSNNAKMQGAIDKYKNAWRDRKKNMLSVDKIQESANILQSISTNLIAKTINEISDFDSTSTLRTTILSFRSSFLYIIEVMMLVTGLFGPIAVALSIFPVGNKPLKSWIISFVSLGFCKICFTLISGLSALAMVYSDAEHTDMLVASIVLGLLAPVLAFVVASGSGLAALNTIALVSQSYGLNPGVSYGAGPVDPNPNAAPRVK
jgi:hypothetical protein